MNNILTLAVCFGLIALVGCGEPTVNRPEAIEVQGQVSSADGKPVTNVILRIQPVEGNGFPVNLKLDQNGGFKDKIVPGTYVYFFQPIESGPAVAKSKAAMKGIPDNLKQPKADNKVEIKTGSVTITLKS
jgi:hypothetical protein